MSDTYIFAILIALQVLTISAMIKVVKLLKASEVVVEDLPCDECDTCDCTGYCDECEYYDEEE